MPVKRKSGNNGISDEEDAGINVFDGAANGSTKAKHELHQTTKKNKVSERSIGMDDSNPCKIDDTPPDVVDQLNYPSTQQQPYPMMNRPDYTNIMQPVMVEQSNRPSNVTLYPTAQCWCSQLSEDMRGIRELISTVSNGVQCILQKIHIDQVHNAEMMAKILSNIEMITDTLTHLPVAQLQGVSSVHLILAAANLANFPLHELTEENLPSHVHQAISECDQFLLEEVPMGNGHANPNEADIQGQFYQSDEDQTESPNPPNHPPTSGNFQSYPIRINSSWIAQGLSEVIPPKSRYCNKKNCEKRRGIAIHNQMYDISDT
uniref:Uncharacterized protein n=1 Tax=Setaria digitata TaxID=48799 RepID=A0A915Q6L9_9BILA